MPYCTPIEAVPMSSHSRNARSTVAAGKGPALTGLKGPPHNRAGWRRWSAPALSWWKEHRLKLALREGMTPGQTLPEQLAWLARTAFDGIELHGRALSLPPHELRAILTDSPVAVANVSGDSRLLDPDPAERAAAREILRARLDLAAALGASGVLLVPQFGRQPALPDLSPHRSAIELEMELLIVQLRELAPAAAAAGVAIFLEPLNRYEAHLINRLEQAVAVCRRVGPSVKVMADFFHMNIEETDIAASIRAAGADIVYVHVADSNRLQPGRGHLDFRPGFGALKAVGYDGYLGIECQVDGPIEEALREAAGLLRGWWAATR
jgi:sugar phosphate isomerase/epimerase